MPKKLKERPTVRPGWRQLLEQALPSEKDELNLVHAAFQDGTFTGKLVVNWCAKCGRWRCHYVPDGKEVALDATFKCVICETDIPLIVEGDYIVLRSGEKRL
jgi:hypothetical protein